MALPIQQVPTISPQQGMLKAQIGNQASQLLQNLGQNQFNFQPIAQKARTQFQTQTIPGLAERFTRLGGSNRQGSSDFLGSLGQAGAGLEENLASLESQYGLQQQGQQNSLLQSLLSLGLQPEFENIAQEQQPGFWSSLIGNSSPALGQFAVQEGGNALQNYLTQGRSGAQQDQSSKLNMLLKYLPALIGLIGGGVTGGPAGAAGGYGAGSSVGGLLSRLKG